MKEGCLFVLFCLSFSNLNSYCHTLEIEIVGKSLMNRGALSWFHNVSTHGGEVIEY
jgi:hypothetical protein